MLYETLVIGGFATVFLDQALVVVQDHTGRMLELSREAQELTHIANTQINAWNEVVEKESITSDVLPSLTISARADASRIQSEMRKMISVQEEHGSTIHWDSIFATVIFHFLSRNILEE